MKTQQIQKKAWMDKNEKIKTDYSRPFPHYCPVSNHKEMRTRLGWTFSYKPLYFDILDYRLSTVLSSKVIICKLKSSLRKIFRKFLWFTSRMEFLRIEISYDCGVIKGYQTRITMSEESHNRKLVWDKIPHSFQYVTWSFLWGRQIAIKLKLYFSCKNSFS